MSVDKKQNTVETVRSAVAPVAEGLGLQLWDVRYEKEGPDMFLRLFIDKPGGVNIDDCEAMSRAADPIIDELDVADGTYFFEVSSPGLGRLLRSDGHLEAYVGKKVRARLIRPDEDGQKDFAGTLLSYDEKSVTLESDGGEKRINRRDAAYIKASDDEDLGGITE